MGDGKQHVYIIGSKGIPAKYGGFETFVEKLTEYQVDKNIQYHVACMTENSAKSGIADKHFEHNGAKCFNIDVPNIGPARAIYYDIASLKYAISLAKRNKHRKPIFYILACRIGPYMSFIKRKIKKINGVIFVNPDGHEWMRKKWSYPVRGYWKYSERLMVKNADLLVCDSKNIESYIKEKYASYSPSTIYISYGTDIKSTSLKFEDKLVRKWFKENGITEEEYYLVVGRFVPENNYKFMIKEFMKSKTTKDLVLITNVEKNKFYFKLKEETHFDQDSRVKFVGTVYNQDLLKYIRKNAHVYIHGHEVGGTNPSLLEALAATKINLLIDVGFNKEVGNDGAIYWHKKNLCKQINKVERLSENDIEKLENRAKHQIRKNYSWEKIIQKYESCFRENFIK
ncbi:DUF1972 domain-containing protein [Enterococcus gilvus]|uniref:beta 1-4 rhamnosyltransferase Cps2T n=1 Tax=Enterococcus gilvus TaxID=160453 RepID=UPI003D6ADBC5